MAESVFLGGGAITPSLIHQATVTLTDAEIKAVGSTPVTLVAAPGANKIIVPTWAVLRLNWVANYGGFNEDDYWALRIGSNTVSTLLYQHADQALLTGFLAASESRTAILRGAGESPLTSVLVLGAPIYDELAVNATLQLTGSVGALTGGDAANTLQVSVAYLVLNLTTGAYE